MVRGRDRRLSDGGLDLMKLEAPKPWTHASPSQVTTARRCLRLWWLDKIAGMPRKSTPATELGGEVHAVAETWLERGLDAIDPNTRPWRIFAPGRVYLPCPPVPITQIEQWIGQPGTCEPFRGNPRGIAMSTPVVPLVGRVDLREPASRMITDHKTTSDERWMVSPDQLIANPQAVIYCAAEFVQLPDYASGAPRPITFRHVYYLTRGAPRSFERRVAIEHGPNQDRFGAILEELERLDRHSTVIDGSKVKPTKSACGDYGGCSMRATCKRIDGGLFTVGIKDKMKGGGSTKGLSIRERMKARAKGNASTSSITPPEEETPKLTPEKARALHAARAAERLKARATSSTAERDPDPPNPPDGTARDVVGTLDKSALRGLRILGTETLIKSAKLAELLEHFGIERPTKVDAIAKMYGLEVDGETKAVLLKRIATLEALHEGPFASDKAEEYDGPDGPEEPAPMTIAGDAQAAKETVIAGADLDEPDEYNPAPAGYGEPKAAPAPFLALFIDAIPERTQLPVVYLDELLQPAEAVVRLRDGNAFAYADKFRDGQRAVAELLASELPGIIAERGRFVLVVRSSHIAAAECLAVLNPHAASIVRGVAL